MICYFISFYLGSASVPYSLHFSQFVLYSCLASFLLSSSLYWVCFCGFHLIIYVFFFFCYSSPILFCWSIVLRVGTYHLQLMHTICLLKWTQWFSNATNKDNNKCLLINTFSSTFQCFRSKLDSFQQLRFLHTQKFISFLTIFIMILLNNSFIRIHFLFSSALQCFYHI